MLHIPLTNCLLLSAKQEPYKKASLLTKNIEEFSGKKFRRKGQQAENDQTERVTGLGRRTREEIAKWNQMTALRFQTGGGETSDIPGLPSGDETEKQSQRQRQRDRDNRSGHDVTAALCPFLPPYHTGLSACSVRCLSGPEQVRLSFPPWHRACL